MNERIDVARPWFGREEAAALSATIASGWVAQGPRVAEFERRFAEAVGAEHAVAVSSCTAALHLSLLLADVGSGADVVVPSFSFIASANAVVHAGARPVFADVDALTGNLTPATIEAALTPQTRAVVVVHQGGVPADVGAVRRFCRLHGLAVVEDAACAAGSTYRGAPVGTGAQLAAWSFHPRKLLTTGEGGMITTGNPAWATRARQLREHAMSVSAAARHRSTLPPVEHYPEVGYNFRMTDLQAAVGLVQLNRLPAIVRRRRAVAARYREALAGLPGLRLVADPAWGHTNFQSCWLEVGPRFPLTRDELLAHLAEHDISARRGIMAAHLEPAYSHRQHGPLPVTEQLSANTLVLPLFHQMTSTQFDRVVSAVHAAATVPA